MTILWNIHLYPPRHNCGSEYMAHGINKFLQTKGIHTRVLLQQARKHNITRAYEYENVMVFPPGNDEDIVRNASILFTHLEYTWETIKLGRKYKKPVIQFVHNNIPYASIKDAPEAYVVYNSEWIKEDLNYPNESFVLHPPCDWRYYDTGISDPNKSEFITLINLDHNKGGHVLREIAKRMPDRKFLGVMGSYSEPSNIGQQTDQPDNVTIIRNTPNILPIYAHTRILIMPSRYESWGRTATEAMCSGIPVIANKTPGLQENLGKAGIWADRENVDEWVKAIEKLDNAKEYKRASEACKRRSRELDPLEELENFHEWLLKIKGR